MIRTTLLAAGLSLFALTAAPITLALADEPGAQAATAKKKPAKRVVKKSNAQSKVTYDSRTGSWMTSSDYKYRYGR